MIKICLYFIRKLRFGVKERSRFDSQSLEPIPESQTVRLIETVRLFFPDKTLRSYCMFNRVTWKIFQSVRLIQTLLIIESTEYLY